MIKEFSLRGKVALVTGAGRGIGRAIAQTLAEAGADIAAAARTVEQLEDTAVQVRGCGSKCLVIPTDVTRTSEVDSMVQETVAEFGKIDILVNNAGLIIVKPLVPMLGLQSSLSRLIADFGVAFTEAEWHKQIDTNLTSVYLCLRAVVPHMMERSTGRIVNVSSLDASKAFSYHAAYAATKAALSMMTKVLAKEWARYNIRVNAVAPGVFRTTLNEVFFQDEDFVEGMRRSVPLRRFGELRDLGLLVLFLASDASSYITGQTIIVDGGMSL